MPIKRKSGGGIQLPEIGRLRKGGPKEQNRMGKDLDHFRFTSDMPGVEQAFKDLFGDQPRDIPFIAPFATVDDFYSEWFEEWQASGLVRRCDGERIVGGLPHLQGLPCERGSGSCQCKPRGRLSMFIPDLVKASGQLGVVVFSTTSFYDVNNISAALHSAEALFGSVQGAELILQRYESEVSFVNEAGENKKYRKWLCRLAFNSGWMQEQIGDGSGSDYEQLPPGEDYDYDAETGEVIDTPPAQIAAPKRDDSTGRPVSKVKYIESNGDPRAKVMVNVGNGFEPFYALPAEVEKLADIVGEKFYEGAEHMLRNVLADVAFDPEIGDNGAFRVVDVYVVED